jgi:hypothetical protein
MVGGGHGSTVLPACELLMKKFSLRREAILPELAPSGSSTT